MPTFDFQCDVCGHTFEESLPFGSKAKPACPVCKGKMVMKLISPPTVVFKGTGFYKTDGNTPAASMKKPASPDTPSASEGKNTTAPPASTDDGSGKNTTMKPEV